MNEIIEIYEKQMVLYKEIKLLLLNIRNMSDEKIDYELKLKEINYTLDNIRKISERGEQLKQIYVLKHNLKDFTGEYIKKVESPDNYEKLKHTVSCLTEEIKAVKKLQDEVINSINREAEESWQKLKEFNDNKRNFDSYEKSYKSRPQNIIDIKR